MSHASMRAVVLHGTTLEFRTDYPQPLPAPGEVLVRILYAGLCETDWQLIRGYMGFNGVLGHEFVGIAESGRWAGRRVVGEINCSCRNCPTCLRGEPRHCPHRSVLGIDRHDGVFADYVTVPEINLHAVPDEVSTRAALFTEPLAAAFQIPEQIPIVPGQTAVVLGDGRLGALCAQVLKQHGAETRIIGKHASKCARLKALGLTAELGEHVVADRSADLVVDCTGSAIGLSAALAWVRPQGTIVLKTTVAGEHTLSLAQVVIDEITVTGSRCGPFPPALAALLARKIAVEPLIDVEFPLEEAVSVLTNRIPRADFKTILRIAPPH